MHFPPGSVETQGTAISAKTSRIVDTLRTLRGRNKALLVKTADGRHFVQKFHRNAADQNLLFNEAFASQIGSVLNLSFPAWCELIGDSSEHHHSSFGSELVSGDIFEYLPGGWYQNIENGADAYRCLLFDLWCNHTDTRQAVFQARSARILRVFFVDHDQMFASDDEISVSKRIARTRYLDRRLYRQYFGNLIYDLRHLADRMRLLVRNRVLRKIDSHLPATWGSVAHREQAISGLERRSGQLNSYIEAIAHFAAGISQSETR